MLYARRCWKMLLEYSQTFLVLRNLCSCSSKSTSHLHNVTFRPPHPFNTPFPDGQETKGFIVYGRSRQVQAMAKTQGPSSTQPRSDEMRISSAPNSLSGYIAMQDRRGSQGFRGFEVLACNQGLFQLFYCPSSSLFYLPFALCILDFSSSR